MLSGITVVAIVSVSLVIYLLVVWWVSKWLKKHQLSCVWRSTFLALFLAPGLLLYGQHASIPVPAFAWMAGLANAYNCIEYGLFCDIKLNLYLSILPFIANWIFVYLMCNGAKEDTPDQ